MNNTAQKPYLLAGFIFALSGAILFSTKAILVKLAFKETNIDAISLLALRMLFSPAFLLSSCMDRK